MSGSEEENPLDALKSQHNREKKELQGQITSLKHSMNKNDKKRKKEVQAIIDSWEEELKEKHEKEWAMAMLEAEMSQSSVTSSAANNIEDDTKPVKESVISSAKRKTTRAQLRREKKAEQAQKRLEAMEEYEKNAGVNLGKIETDAISGVLQARNLRIHEIAPDGDCLYNSLSHQINKGREISGPQLRAIAAKYIREHRDELLSFLTDEHGERVDEFGFDEYCSKVERTSAQGGTWGGGVELRAISYALRRPVEVVQADRRNLLFGEEFSSPPLVITYHRFAYTLGEHYNSTSLMPVDVPCDGSD